MINYSTIETLVGNDKGQRKKFVDYILGSKANRPLSYFRDHDVTFSTAEKICDYFSVPMDMLRDTPCSGNNVAGNNNNGRNISINSNLVQENSHLRAQIESLKETIMAKNETIQAYKRLVNQSEDCPNEESLK